MIRAALVGFAVGVTATLAALLRGVRSLTPYERTWIGRRR